MNQDQLFRSMCFPSFRSDVKFIATHTGGREIQLLIVYKAIDAGRVKPVLKIVKLTTARGDVRVFESFTALHSIFIKRGFDVEILIQDRSRISSF